MKEYMVAIVNNITKFEVGIQRSSFHCKDSLTPINSQPCIITTNKLHVARFMFCIEI